MMFLRPSEISGRILTLFEQSNERVIIVSPFVKISKWFKLLNRLEDLKTRQIPIEIYVREESRNQETYRELDQLSLPYKRIPHLHSKIYLNEHTGIQTSMNLLLSSDTNSLEIGYETETREEYNDLLGYYYRYICKTEFFSMDPEGDAKVVATKVLLAGLKEALKGGRANPALLFKHKQLHIQVRLNYYLASLGGGKLRLTVSMPWRYGVREKSQPDPHLIAKKIKNLAAMNVTVHPGSIHGSIRISGQAHRRLSSPSIAGLREGEVAYVVKVIHRFIAAVEGLSENEQCGPF